MAQITSLVGTLDQKLATPAPTSAPVDAVSVRQARPRDVARAVARELPQVNVSVSGSDIIVRGDPDQVAKAKDLIGTLVQPQGFPAGILRATTDKAPALPTRGATAADARQWRAP